MASSVAKWHHASWLNRLETGTHTVTASKLIVLAHIYGLHAEHFFRTICPDQSVPDPQTEATTLLFSGASTSGPYKWGIIGEHNQFLVSLMPVGSYVQVDTRKRVVPAVKNWVNEFQRPIYFLKVEEGCSCGWCESDPLGRSLALVPIRYRPLAGWHGKTGMEWKSLIAL
jgi:hypothetical protein